MLLILFLFFCNLLDVLSLLEANVFSFSPSETNDFGSSPSDGNIVRLEANINTTTLSGGSRSGFFCVACRAVRILAALGIVSAPLLEAKLNATILSGGLRAGFLLTGSSLLQRLWSHSPSFSN